jgi:hypothetical protein
VVTAGGENVLLPGENPETALLDDAEHWVNVYGELVADLVDLGSPEQLERLKGRLEFWLARVKELTTLTSVLWV